MIESLHASFYADGAVHETVEVVENRPIARDTYLLRFRFPELARSITPGQFVMVRLSSLDDPLLGRPLALYETVVDDQGEGVGIDVVYLVQGKFTQRLATYVAGQKIDVWGPLGNGFPPQPAENLIMVAGGIGQTPFVAMASEALGRRAYGSPPRKVAVADRVTLCYGARTADLLAGVDDFEQIGVDIRLATDDGTRGHHGFVTDLLRQVLSERPADPRIVCCGPEPMMEAVAQIALEAGVPCQVSLETPMACGIGICFSCVARVRTGDGSWDYRRTCVEGPVFDAECIVW